MTVPSLSHQVPPPPPPLKHQILFSTTTHTLLLTNNTPSYSLITLTTHPSYPKVPPSSAAALHLSAANITTHPYESIESFLSSSFASPQKVVLDPAQLNWRLYNAVGIITRSPYILSIYTTLSTPSSILLHKTNSQSPLNQLLLSTTLSTPSHPPLTPPPPPSLFTTLATPCVLEQPSPCTLWKALKSPAEMAGIRACHIRDGAALTAFLCWLERTVASGTDKVVVMEHPVEMKIGSYYPPF